MQKKGIFKLFYKRKEKPGTLAALGFSFADLRLHDFNPEADTDIIRQVHDGIFLFCTNHNAVALIEFVIGAVIQSDSHTPSGNHPKVITGLNALGLF